MGGGVMAGKEVLEGAPICSLLNVIVCSVQPVRVERKAHLTLEMWVGGEGLELGSDGFFNYREGL